MEFVFEFVGQFVQLVRINAGHKAARMGLHTKRWPFCTAFKSEAGSQRIVNRLLEADFALADSQPKRALHIGIKSKCCAHDEV